MTETAIETNQATDLHTLHFENLDAQNQSPNLLVRWTLNPGMIERMRELKAYRAYIVIVVGTFNSPEEVRRSKHHATQAERDEDETKYDPNSTIDERRHVCLCADCKEGRYISRRKDIHIFQVDDPIGLIEIHRAGTHTITSFLVFSSVEKHHRDRDFIRHAIETMSCDGILPWRMDPGPYEAPGISYHPSKETHQITIEPTCFAKPRKKSRIWWATLWLNKPANECGLWKRYLFAYSVQAILIGIWIILRAVYSLFAVTYLFLRGWRHISLKPIIHPFDLNVWGDETPTRMTADSDLAGLTEEEREDPHGNFILYDKNGNRRSRLGTFIRMPTNWIWLTSLCYFWIKYPRTITVFVIFVITVLLFAAIAGKLIGVTARYLDSRQKNKKEVKEGPDRITTYQKLIQRQTTTPTHQHINLGTRVMIAKTRFKARACLPFADN